MRQVNPIDPRHKSKGAVSLFLSKICKRIAKFFRRWWLGNILPFACPRVVWNGNNCLSSFYKLLRKLRSKAIFHLTAVKNETFTISGVVWGRNDLCGLAPKCTNELGLALKRCRKINPSNFLFKNVKGKRWQEWWCQLKNSPRKDR